MMTASCVAPDFTANPATSAGPPFISTERVLSTLLAYAGVAGDPAATARRLLRRFGTLGAVLRATPRELEAQGQLAPGVVEVVHAVLAVHRAAIRERLPERLQIADEEALIDFLEDELRHRPDEAVLGLFLDADLRLVAIEVVAVGGVSHCPLSVREVAGRCFAHGASALILAHNHPSGSLAPSDLDVATTRRLQQTLSELDVDLLDHVIVGRGVYSIVHEMERR
jgi:DNA repair protein RadC